MKPVKASLRTGLFIAAALVASSAYAAKPGPTEAAVPSGSVAPPLPTLVWNKASGAVQYQLQGYDKQNKKVFATKVPAADANCTSRPFCRIIAPKAFPNGPNKWRVRAGNSDGWGPWSEWSEFWVGGPAIAFSSFAVRRSIVPGAQTITSLTIDVPDRGAVAVTSQGYLRCTRSNSAGSIDITAAITDNPNDSALGSIQPDSSHSSNP